jgi:hypothetical protein
MNDILDTIAPPQRRHRVTPGKVGATGGVLFAASAVAAAAWYDWEHRRVTRALLSEANVKIERLVDLKLDKETLGLIEEGLRKEWGPFALVGFSSIEEMAAKAGATVFVALQKEGSKYLPKAALQTTLVDVHGDAELLQEAYPSFHDLTSPDAWKRARHHGGDTVVLLQIAVFESGERGAGLGSLLRNAVLHMLGTGVKYALTTTPVDPKPGAAPLDLADPATYTPSMKFHIRGGALPATVLPGYKTPEDADTPLTHGRDVSVMRYARDDDGKWPAPRPEMRLRLLGPFEERLFSTALRLRFLSARSRRALQSVRHKEPVEALPA